MLSEGALNKDSETGSSIGRVKCFQDEHTNLGKRKLEAKKERDVSQAVEAWASGSKVIKNPKARRSGKFGRDLKNKMERKESPKEAEHPVEKVMDAVDSWFGDTSWRSRGRSPAARETKERAAVPTAHKTKGHKRTLSGK